MKKYFLFALLLPLAIAVSCKDEDTAATPILKVFTDNDITQVSDNVLSFTCSKDGASKSIRLETNLNEWTATAPADVDWVHLAFPGGKYLTLKVDAHSGFESRQTTVTISGGAAPSVTLNVQQLGEQADIVFDRNPANYSVGVDADTLRVKVTANVEYTIVIPDTAAWITYVRKAGDWELFAIADNTAPAARSAEIEFKEQGGSLSKKLKVTQEGLGTFTPGTPGGFAEDVKVPVSSVIASESHAEEGIDKTIDGNMSTMFHSQWGAPYEAETSFPVTLEYNFTAADFIDYLIYYPRSIGGNGHFGEVKLHVKANGSSAYTLQGTYNFNKSTSPSPITFSPALTNVTAIKFEVLTGNNNFVSCAEMEFYKKDLGGNDFSAIFADDVYSEIKPDVTLAQINAMDNEFMRNIAKFIFLGQYDMRRVAEYKAYPNPDIFAAANKTAPLSLLDNPTGIEVATGEEIVVFVGGTGGKNVSLRVQDFSKTSSTDIYYGQTYSLLEGINTITISNKGLAYIYYFDEDPAAPNIKVHIPSGKVNGYFDITKHNHADFVRLLDNATHKYMDMVGRNAHSVFEVASYRQYVSDVVSVVNTFDQMVEYEYEISGLRKLGHLPKNRYFLHVDYGDNHMYATSYHMGFNIATMATILTPSSLTGVGIWGPAHEMGHVMQVRPGMRWAGMVEVTVNIMSAYVQTRFGNECRIQAENQYQNGFNTIIVPEVSYGQGDVWGKLVPLWQLYLYAVSIGNTEFYQDLHNKVRSEADRAATEHGKMQLDFVKYACDLLQRDLRDFFTQWGFLREANFEIDDYGLKPYIVTAAEVADMNTYIAGKSYSQAPSGLHYISDANAAMFGSSGRQAIVSGTAVTIGQTVRCTGWSNVVAYEVWHGGARVFVSPTEVFTIPAEYPVAACTVKAVAWDGTKVDVGF